MEVAKLTVLVFEEHANKKIALSEKAIKGDITSLRQAIAGSLGKQRGHFMLVACDKILPMKGDVEEFIFPGHPIFAFPRSADASSSVTLTIKMPGKVFTLTADSNVASLQNEVQKQKGIPVDEQRLVFQGKSLLYGMPLDYYGIRNGSEVSLLLRLRGGSPLFRFADLQSQMRERRWDPLAPERRKAGAGLCLEGTCTQSGCRAKGKMVIMKQGFGTFDIDLDKYKCICPCCRSLVQPLTAAFTSAEFKWWGKKVGEI